jgi:predicted secreted Zn-dependent protease
MLRIVPAGTITAGTSHTFDAATLRDLAASMAGLDEVGHADFDLALAFSTDGGNRLTNVDLTMTLTIDMPVWTQVSSRPEAERNEWNRFHRALRAHEDGHISICRAEAPTTYEKLTKATASTINDVLEAERLRIKRLNDAYDTRTGHGTRQQTAHGSTTITVP